MQSWDDVPDYIRRTYDKLGIPEAEKKYLAGVGGQYDSEVVYHNIREDLEKQGVLFLGTDEALQKYPEIFREHFGTVIPANDNKLAALNTAVWTGGSFIYVPKGVHVELPLQAYFRINTENMGQFERTLIIADEGSSVHYVEGCTAPTYSTASLHSAVVEIIVKKGARVRYTTIQNWSHNVYNLVTKRAVAHEDAVMEWVDGNLGSKVTMKYPSIYLLGERAHGEVLSIAFAGDGQHQDAGGKIIHAAPNTTSLITSKSISKGTGRTSYRGLIKVYPGCEKSKSTVRCDALILDEEARSDTYPYMEIDEEDVTIGHEATVSKVGVRAALLPDEPRPLRGRGERHDRERLHRADRQGAADGVRGRDEPPHPAPDGGRGRVTAVTPPASAATALDADAIARISRTLGEPEWLRDLRASWWERVAADPAADRPGGGVAARRRSRPAARRRPADAMRRALEVDLPHGLAEQGVVLTDLRTAVREHPELVRRFLGPG